MSARWILRRAVRELGRRKARLAALAAAMAMTAALGGLARLGTRVGATLLPGLQQRVHVIAYLDDELPAGERDRLLEALRRLPGVERARLVTPEEASARLRAAASSLGGPAALGPLEPGFLPRSVEIGVRPAPELASRTAELAARLRRIKGIAEVDDMSEGLGRLEAWLALVRRLGQLALTLALIAAAAGVAMALVGWRGRGRDVEVLRLLGETPAAIALPPSLTGAAAALLGAVVGLGGIAVLFPRLLSAVAGAARLAAPAVPGLGAADLLLVLVAAPLVGALAGYLGCRSPRHA
jgi:cell division protein FtsX